MGGLPGLGRKIVRHVMKHVKLIHGLCSDHATMIVMTWSPMSMENFPAHAGLFHLKLEPKTSQSDIY